MKAFLKLAMGDASVRADEAGAELDPDRAHFEVSGDRLAAADPAGDEDRNIFRDVGQDFLRQHRGRHRADVAAGLHALDDQRVGARAYQFLREGQRGREADQLRAARFDPVDRAARGKAAGKNDVGDAMIGADVDQLGQLRVHGDEIDAERPVGARLGLGDLGVEQFGAHRSAGDYSEPAGVGDGGDQMALGNPAHRAAHDGDVAAEELGAAVHQLLEPGVAGAEWIARGSAISPSPLMPLAPRRGRRRCGGRAPRGRARLSAISALTLISLDDTASRLISARPASRTSSPRAAGWSGCRRRRC